MAGSYWRVTIFGTGGNSNTQTVWHFTSETVNSGEVIANSLKTNLFAYLKSRITGNPFVWTGIKVEPKGTNQGTPFNLGLNEAGSAGTGILPMQVATVWNIFTGSGGRRRRGRIFWPAVLPAHNTNGILNSVGAAQHDSVRLQMLNYFCAGANDTGIRLVLRSRADDEQFPVTAISVTTVFGTLGTRRIGVGY